MKTYQLTESERKLCLDCLYYRLAKICDDYQIATGRRERKTISLERKHLMSLICKLEGKPVDFGDLEP